MAALSEDQKKVFTLVAKGFSLFITGKAGSGKSYLLKSIIKDLKMRSKGVFVTASTGIAAQNISGSTIHSFAGIGTGKKSAHELAVMIKSNPAAVKKWEECEILVIDEVSMLSRELFEKIEYVARILKKNQQPFGGIQLILCGDFFQLKPVIKDDISDEEVFCFCSPVWKKCVDFNLFLNHVYRQCQPELLNVLDDFRSCTLTMFTTNFVRYNLSRPLLRNPLDIVRLFSHVIDAREANDKCLDLLPGERFCYKSKDSGDVEKLKTCTALKSLILKLNARVVLLRNLDNELVNGLCGHVVSTIDGLPVVKFDNNKVAVIKECIFTVEDNDCVVATRKQVPLDLAYALTIHRSQGMGFDSVEVHVDKVFEPGQAYVALSRARSVEGLRVVGEIKSLPQISPVVKEFYKNIVHVDHMEMAEVEEWPLKRDCHVLPSLDVSNALPVPSNVPEPEEIALSSDYQGKTIPDDARLDISDAAFEFFLELASISSLVFSEQSLLRWLYSCFRRCL